jgi:DNA polymerase-3 subunit beta
MRFTIDRNYFLKGLTTASKAITSKIPMPLLTNLKLSLDSEGLFIIGSNGDLTIRSKIPYIVNDKEIIRNADKGEILVSSKLITEIVRRVEGEEINLEVIDETAIQIDDGKSNFQLNSIRAEEYPDIDLSPSGVNFDMPCSLLSQVVEQTAFAASVKEQRASLTALNILIEDNKLIATATDSARMAKKVVDLDINDHTSVNISAKTMYDIIHLFENEKTVNIALDEKKALFMFGDTTVSTRLINDEYPNTKNLVPKTFNYFLQANSQELVSAMERVSLLSGERENVVKLTMTEDGVEIAAKSSQVGSAKESIETFKFTGDRLEVSFNCNYVIAAIRALKSEEVTIEFIGEMKPFVVKNEADDSVVQLVTPLRTY